MGMRRVPFLRSLRESERAVNGDIGGREEEESREARTAGAKMEGIATSE